MHFMLNDEQLMIRDTAARFLAEQSTSAAIRRAMQSETGYDPALWHTLSGEMGWSAIHIPEAYGGLGLGYVELALLMEEMGRHLLCSPFHASVALGANALLVAGSEAQKQHWLPAMASGEITATLALPAKGGLWQADAVTARWRQEGEAYVLDGVLNHVPNGHSAGLIIVAAREAKTGGGTALFLLPANTQGLSRTRQASMDQTRPQTEIRLDKVVLPLSARMTGGHAELATLLDLAAIAIAAEQLGVAQAALDSSVAYSKERQQFGRAIAGYQAIKHRAADMMLKAELARSAVYYAACLAQETLSASQHNTAELAQAASLAKAYASEAAFYNAGCGIQLFGGVGITSEYDIQLYFKRAQSTAAFLGSPAWHRARIAAQLLD